VNQPSFPLVLVGKIPVKYQPTPIKNTNLRYNSSFAAICALAIALLAAVLKPKLKKGWSSCARTTSLDHTQTKVTAKRLSQLQKQRSSMTEALIPKMKSDPKYPIVPINGILGGN
jgi:hypothetical protein